MSKWHSRITQVSKPTLKLRVCHPQTHPLHHCPLLPFSPNFTLSPSDILKRCTLLTAMQWPPSLGCRNFFQPHVGPLCGWGNDGKGSGLSVLTFHMGVYSVPPPAGCAACSWTFSTGSQRHPPQVAGSSDTSLRPPALLTKGLVNLGVPMAALGLGNPLE